MAYLIQETIDTEIIMPSVIIAVGWSNVYMVKKSILRPYSEKIYFLELDL